MFRLNPQLRCLILYIGRRKILHIMGLDNNFGLKVFKLACRSSDSPRCLNEFSFCGTNSDILIDYLGNLLGFLELSFSSFQCIFSSDDSINKDSPIKTSKEISSVEEIYISMLKISKNDAIHLVENCKSLKRLCYKADDNADIDYLKAKLGVEWQVTNTKCNEMKRYDIIIMKRNTMISNHRRSSVNTTILSNTKIA